ncbi:dihydrolipoamide acetyltransferase family protein [uncultured Bacteroides sp.]|uniref:dihydrolipoamide acetyltransferase family protein n=1 Tax=uncultured Bacteroides sp. TaxID=162156 RepID=UPI0025D1E9B4|nr:dihydrolipoamide acetyltransferase family protein [uncultured Bacteroides sp.]
MSRFEIKMPKLGESITEGTIVSWSVQVGDIVKEDDVLFEVNTAKVSAEVPSPVAGKVVEILFKEGDTVAVGTVVAIVNMGDEGGEEPLQSSPEIINEKAEVAPPETASPQQLPQAKAVQSEEARWYSPVVLLLAREFGIRREELDTVPGTGYQGRVSKKDIRNYIVRKQRGNAAATIKSAVKPASATTSEVHHNAPAPNVQATEGVEVKEMDRVRKVIADHMVMSKHTSPHVTNVVEVDVTKLVKWRDKNKDAFFRKEGVKLTYMPAITEAVAKALVAYPQVNVSVEGYNILFKKHINIGIAVSLNDGNLIVPVVRDADRLNLNGLAVAIDSLALKARDNKLMPDDISGGTFTITNFGTFKSLFGTPIINQPQVAILGVGYIEKKPAVIETPEGDVIAIRHKMYLSLSYDHRVVDGSLGGNFLYYIKEYLENWKE